MDDLDLDLEDVTRPEGTPNAAAEPKPATHPAGEDDLQVEIDESDPLYKRADWKTDPLTHANDPNDADYGPRVQKRINKLRASLSEAAKQRDRHARERDEAVNLTRGYLAKIAEMERQIATGSAQQIDQQATAEAANAKVAEQNLRQALTVGDPDAITKANSDLAIARAREQQLRVAADYRKAQIMAQPAAPQVPQFQQQAQRPAADPELTKWQERNSWFQSDPEMTDTAFELHDELAAKGVRVGSPVYYKTIEQEIQKRFPDYFGAAPAQQQKPSSPLAPSSRMAGTSQQDNGGNPNRVRLSASQVATAKALGLTPLQYAKELVRLRQEGVNI